MGQDCPDQGEDHPTEGNAEDEDSEWGLSIVPGGAVHHQGQFPVWKERKQDVQDVLRGELQIVEDARHSPRLRFQGRGTGEVQRDFAVQGRLSLEDPEEHFGEPQQRVRSTMR